MVFNFCPRCSGSISKTNPPACVSCGFVVYVNPVPSAAVIARKEGRFVLIRRAVEPGKGGLGFPGGFIEVDESFEEGARREFKEETGMDCVGELNLLCVVSVKYEVPGVEKDVVCAYFVAKDVSGFPQAGKDESEVVFKTGEELTEDVLVIGDNKTAFHFFKEKYK